MTIIGPIKTPTGNRVGQHKVLCCSFVASLLPETGSPEGCGEADPVGPPLALPPEGGEANPEGAAPDLALRRFYEHLHRTLPWGLLSRRDCSLHLRRQGPEGLRAPPGGVPCPAP
jgi:hypothetical protein